MKNILILIFKIIVAVIAFIATIVAIVPGLRENINIFKSPSVILHSVKIFHIKIDENMYQIGLIAELINLDDKSYIINGLTLKAAKIDLAARSTISFYKYHNPTGICRVPEDVLVKPNSPSLVKIIMPLKIDMKVHSDYPPEAIIFADWLLHLKGKEITTKPKYYGNYDKVLSLDEWNNILNTGNADKLESVMLKIVPLEINKDSELQTHLLFNPDRSADVNIYGFDKTTMVSNSNGVMVFVVGRGRIPLEGGWNILGNSYPEVWADSNKLKLYNSVYPPHDDGSPKPFGVFQGYWEKMGVKESVPTSTGQGIITIQLSD